MASKRSYNEISGGEQSEEGQNPAKINCPTDSSSSSSQQQVETLPEAGKKGPDAGHGNRFQSKLLILYAVRAINAGYQFILGTELSVGEKFDDLIFHYKGKDDITAIRQQYLQAKHRLNENNVIKADNLLDVNNGDFSLVKYFQSYVKIRSQGNAIEHCIICTNVDFDQNLYKEIKKYGMIVLGIRKNNWPKLLDIKSEQACYKLKVFDHSKNTLSIRNCIINCTGEEMKSLFQNCTEVVNGKQFNDHTVNEMNSFFSNCQNQNQVVQKLVEFVFDDFLDKMIFAVKTPNETKLDDVLKDEVGKYFNLTNAALQSVHFMNEMVNWFKLTDEKHHWLTAEEAEEILKSNSAHIKVIELTSFSVDYQKQLKQIKTSENDELEFEDTAINQSTSMLQSFWNSQEKIKHVSSKTPKLTAVKVFSAIKKLPKFLNKDDYLVISSKRLKEKKKKVKKSMKVVGHNLLVVVDEDAKNPLEDSFYEKFIPKNLKKKVIVISNQNSTKESYDEDTINYGQLNENTKKVLRERQVSFQGNDLTVNDLIDMKLADKVLDSQLIENLLQTAGDDQIVISSFNTSSFEKFLYIERKLKFPSKEQLLNKLANIEEKPDKKVDEQTKVKRTKIIEEIEINQNGKIEWQIEDEKRKQEIWKEFKVLLEQNNSNLQLFSIVSEKDIDTKIDTSNKRIIITGVAGTGKSTILSHYYEINKKNKLDNLVIKISLDSFSKILKETKNFNEFLINNVVDQNSFARTLLKHRLKTGDRIILMLDGFDEIDTECQSKVVQLVKTLDESIPLYITTRPHLADKLQFELSQLAYSLDKFDEDDEIHYLTSIWKEYLKKDKVVFNDNQIETFAKQLIFRVSETLKDKEKEFIGIPLQCRILAECFQSKIQEKIIREPNTDLSHLIGDQQFDLADLYRLMIEEKRKVFLEEKIKVNFGQSHIVDNSIKINIKKTEDHLRKLAVQTIVHEQQYVDILIPSGEVQSEFERKNEKKELNENGIRFGLLGGCGENEIEFLHRTYAEYLVADYIFNGFLLDDDQHNNLLENESIRKWIIAEILVKDNYEGVRVFFDSMLKEIILQEEWKNKIQNKNLPHRLQQFPSFFFKNDVPAFKEAFKKAFKEMNPNILLFIFDCLDVPFTKRDISSDIIQQMMNERASFFRQRSDVFDRCLNYFSLNYYSVNENLSEFSKGLSRELELLKQQIDNKNLERFLDFVGHHVIHNSHHDYTNFHELTVFFIRSEMEEETRKKFFKILTSKYSKDFELTRVMEFAINKSLERYDCQICEIEKALTILRELRRIKVAGELSRFVLFRKSETLKKEENVNVRLSLEKMGMTGLHGAAFKGDLSLIEKEIGSLENPENCSEEEIVLQLMTNEEDLVPPFYLAAAYGHDDICKKIFRFIDLEKEISDTKGFLHRSLNHAMKYENVVMIQTILRHVKEIQGGNDLVKLLQSVIVFYKSNKLVVKTITDIFMQDTENGCRNLNDLVFNNRSTLLILEQVECDVLQKLIAAAGGLDKWIKRLMGRHLHEAFVVLSSDGFLAKFNQENQISKLIDILITKSTLDDNKPSEPLTSYWSDFVLKSYGMRKFIEAISKCDGEEDLERLWLYRDDNDVLILFEYLIRNGRSKFNDILYHLPENPRKELWIEEKQKLIDHFFSTPTFLESLDHKQQLNAIEYYLENGNEKQLEKFSQVVKVDLLEKGIALWGGKEKGKKIVGLIKKKKLYSQTVVEYRSCCC